eukprot:2923830-Pyramimonas_sp.AAC.2
MLCNLCGAIFAVLYRWCIRCCSLRVVNDQEAHRGRDVSRAFYVAQSNGGDGRRRGGDVAATAGTEPPDRQHGSGHKRRRGGDRAATAGMVPFDRLHDPIILHTCYCIQAQAHLGNNKSM